MASFVYQCNDQKDILLFMLNTRGNIFLIFFNKKKLRLLILIQKRCCSALFQIPGLHSIDFCWWLFSGIFLLVVSIVDAVTGKFMKQNSFNQYLSNSNFVVSTSVKLWPAYKVYCMNEHKWQCIFVVILPLVLL